MSASVASSTCSKIAVGPDLQTGVAHFVGTPGGNASAIGTIGRCRTGNFALARMVEPGRSPRIFRRAISKSSRARLHRQPSRPGGSFQSLRHELKSDLRELQGLATRESAPSRRAHTPDQGPPGPGTAGDTPAVLALLRRGCASSRAEPPTRGSSRRGRGREQCPAPRSSRRSRGRGRRAR